LECKLRCLPGFHRVLTDSYEKDKSYECTQDPQTLCSGQKLCGVDATDHKPVCCDNQSTCGVVDEKIACKQGPSPTSTCPAGQALIVDGVGPPRCSTQVCEALADPSKATILYYFEGTCYACTTKQRFDQSTRQCVDNMCRMEGAAAAVPGVTCLGSCCPYDSGTCDSFYGCIPKNDTTIIS
jgi:hypothetical protein